MMQTRTDRRLLRVFCVVLAMVLLVIWLSPMVKISRVGMPQAGEVKYINVLDSNTGRRFTVRDMEQIETILLYLPGERQTMGCMSGNGFLLEFVCRGSRGVVRYVLNASLPLRYARNFRYCEEYLRHLDIASL